MFSPLSRGYGTWTGESFDPYKEEIDKDLLPHIDQNEVHRHGVTINRPHSGFSLKTWPGYIDKNDGKCNLPKTYLTRKGALVLFTSHRNKGEEEEDDVLLTQRSCPPPRSKQKVSDATKIGTLDRLAMSVLQYGDEEEYDHEHESISDHRNKLVMKFIHSLEGKDQRSQPGSDLSTYLRQLKYRSRYGYDTYLPRNQEALELRALLRGFQESKESGTSGGYSYDSQTMTRPSSAGSSSDTFTPRNILSARKLTASLKSLNSYLGRPSSADLDALNTESEYSSGISAKVTRKAPGVPDYPAEITSPSRPKTWVQPSMAQESKEEELNVDRTKFRKKSSPSPKLNFLSNLVTIHDMEDGTDGSEDQGEVSVHGEGRSITGAGGASTCSISGFTEETEGSDFEVLYTVGDKGDANSVVEGSVNQVDISPPMSITPHSNASHSMSPSSSPQPLGARHRLPHSDSESVPLVMGNTPSPTPKADTTDELVTTAPAASAVAAAENSPSPDYNSPEPVVLENYDNLLPRVTIESKLTGEKSSDLPVEKDSSKEVSDAQPQQQNNSAQDYRQDFPEFELESGEQEDKVATQIMLDKVKSEDNNLEGKERLEISDNALDDSVANEENNKKEAVTTNTAQDTDEKFASPVTEAEQKTFEQANVEIPNKERTEEILTESQEEAENTIKNDKEIVHTQNVQHSPESDSDALGTNVINLSPKELEKTNDIDNTESSKEIKPVEENVTSQEQVNIGKETATSLPTEQSQNTVDHRKPHDDLVEKKEEKLQPSTEVHEDEQARKGVATGIESRPMSAASRPLSAVSRATTELSSDVGIIPEPVKVDISGLPLKEEVKAEIPEITEQVQVDQTQDQQKEHHVCHHEEDKKEDAVIKTKSPIIKERTMSIGTEVKSPKPPPGKPTISRPGRLVKKEQKPKAKKDPSKAIGISSVQPDEQETEKTKKTPKTPPVPKVFEHKKVIIPPEKEKLHVPEFIAEAAKRDGDVSLRELDKEMQEMESQVKEAFADHVIELGYTEGLTEEELAMAKKALEEKTSQVKENMGKPGPPTPRKTKEVASVVPKKGGKKKKKEKDPLVIEKERLKEQRKLEQQRKLEEAKALQAKITQKKEQRELKEQEARNKAIALQLEMERLDQQAEEMQNAEENVRAVMAEMRQKQREEREARRKDDLERKKAQVLERRERERKMMDDARKKEQEMLRRIADAETHRRHVEEEERKRDEEERIAQEKIEAELMEAARKAEEEEEKLRELEREAEEEAVQRLINEREEYARQKRLIEEEKRRVEEEEEKKRQLILAEEMRLEEEKRKQQEIENQRIEEEKRRLAELQRMEEEARLQMQKELERRRDVAIARRHTNLERRANMDKLKHAQGLTRAFVWSYFIQWPLESYNIPIGGPPDPKKKKFKPKAKPKAGGAFAQK